MEPTKEFIDELYREEVRDAQQLTVAQRLALSGDLFDSACQVTMWGIRSQHPGISDEKALEELRRRLAISRRLEMRL